MEPAGFSSAVWGDRPCAGGSSPMRWAVQGWAWMKFAEFEIGGEFYCGARRWRCTDIGSRVVIAVCLDLHEVTSLTVDSADPNARWESLHVSDDPSWVEGPPFAVVEEVFDECSIEACSLMPGDEGVGGTEPQS